MNIISVTEKTQYDPIIKEVLEFVQKIDASYSQLKIIYYNNSVKFSSIKKLFFLIVS